VRVRLTTLFLAVTALVVSGATARGQLITNGSFESGSNPPGNLTNKAYFAGSTDIAGWTVISTPSPGAAPLAWIQGNFTGLTDNDYKPSAGNFFLDLTGLNDNGVTFGGVQQTFATTIGQTYQAQFDLITGSGNSAGPIGATLTVGPASQTFTTSNGNSTAQTFTLNFTATTTSTTLSILGASAPVGGWMLGLDNVSVTAIPEPAECAVAAGAIGFVAALWFRRRARAARGFTSRVSSAPC
jgi:hypothetical protein